MMKSCSMTNAVFFACRMNLDERREKRDERNQRRMDVPLDDFARDDTLLGIEETADQSDTHIEKHIDVTTHELGSSIR